jgi:hypothetical protein
MVYKGSIFYRVSIDNCPTIVGKKRNRRLGSRLDDGRAWGGGLLTLEERKSHFTLIERIFYKHTDHVAEAPIDALGNHKKRVYTLTMDNGNEFAQHKKISKVLHRSTFTLPVPIVPGSVGSTRIPTDCCVSISPRAPTLRHSPMLKFDRLKINLMIDPKRTQLSNA